MAILYNFKVVNSSNADSFPPSVANYEQWNKLIEYLTIQSFPIDQLGSFAIIFLNESDLETFLSTYTITDQGLLEDLNTWKTAHGISYISNYYELINTEISYPAIF